MRWSFYAPYLNFKLIVEEQNEGEDLTNLAYQNILFYSNLFKKREI
jgi:hypothetical protein